jgi:Mg-chelatase subunit ChlD
LTDLGALSDWDVATRYHEFKARLGFGKNPLLARGIRTLSISAIIDQARSSLGSITRPLDRVTFPFDALPAEALYPEIDIEETLETAPWTGLNDSQPLRAEDLQMNCALNRRQSIVLAIDTSLSMTGEKLALTAVALCVVLLQFPDDPIGVVAFENEARILLQPGEAASLETVLERFLDVPAKGYTHLENGMKTALRMTRGKEAKQSRRAPATLLLTDGKYTAGKDPSYLAPRFDSLFVLKMGNERSSHALCEEMARSGHGRLYPVEDLRSLPQVMTGLVRDLLRGRFSRS